MNYFTEVPHIMFFRSRTFILYHAPPYIDMYHHTSKSAIVLHHLIMDIGIDYDYGNEYDVGYEYEYKCEIRFEHK